VPQVEIHPEAQAELDAAIAWYEQQSQGLGLDFLDEVDWVIHLASTQPGIWRSYGDAGGLRRLNTRRFPYSLIYRLGDERVQVIAIAHQHRKPGYWRSRVGKPSQD
jgi:plasmid stabilization system protein ParE